MPARSNDPRIYEGDGDSLMREHLHGNNAEKEMEHIILVPDALPSATPEKVARIRILWGQHLLEDLLAGRYRSLVCAVNAQDNSRGIISQLAALLPTSQWDEASVTSYAKQFTVGDPRVRVLKFDMDIVEVLAVLRPPKRDHLTIEDLGTAFRVVAEMVNRRSSRIPSASVSFLGARANRLVDANGEEPAFETVLRTMYEAGYTGDVYPSPQMWHAGEVGLYPRYPFAGSLDRMREGGF